MKEKFKDVRFREESLARIAQCNKIIRDYQAQGLRLTLRQMYYRLVAAALIPNSEKSYKGLSSLVSDARQAGLMDWDAIEDRGRRPDTPPDWPTVASLVETALRSYRLPRWEGQDNYVELWAEKDAISNVLTPISNKFHITFMANKGYSSQSAMYESAQRFLRNGEGKILHLLYLGDHDPSGEDMVRDVKERLQMFTNEYIVVTKVALTMDQIEEYDPPPNPAKTTDPRSDVYIKKFGNESWEVDALPPDILTQIVTDALEPLVDQDAMDVIIEREKSDKSRLRDAAKKILTEDT